MDALDALVEVSRHYGNHPGFVIAGGGNTSYKNEQELFVKASGVSLATIGRDGFVKLSRQKLKELEHATFPSDPSERENEVKLALARAVLSPEHLRPSVETSLHNLIRYRYIIHTHPTLVNAVMCARDADGFIRERFGSEALYMEYTDPGYTLFKLLKGMIDGYEEEHHFPPKIIFLQNHGVFVGADRVEEIHALYDSILARIREGKDLSLPAFQMEEGSTETASRFARHFAGRNLMVKSFRSPLTDYFSDTRERFERISRPFSPDIIVYCKSNYLFLEKGWRNGLLEEHLKRFETRFGYYPKVSVEEQGGLIITEESEKSIRTVLEVFTDMMKISYLSEQFGGPHVMTEEQISFIDSWEVENYRRSVARDTR
jgi:rhamnose utilization protein RhaD (predicted bifunctional aldolase and dehydrogenase)